jgi:CubicO group peptidase (beta-lactamase class C family)
MTASIDEPGLKARAAGVLNRWPVAGLAVGVVRDGSLAWFHGHGVADIESGTPVGQDTVFRIGSITKTITAIAVMQLSEQGLVDLDAPASGYLRAYRLIPAKAGFRPATLRHLLTHTAGVPGGAQTLGPAPAGAGLGHAGRTPGAAARRVLPGRPAHRRGTGHQVGLLRSRVRHAGPDRRGRQRDPARPLPP